MKNILAIFKKQMKDTLKNPAILIQFVMFPCMTILMNHSISIEGMPENFFVTMFAPMYVGMAPLIILSALLSEEKENNTLRVLLMSNVKPHEYLLGVGGYVWLACMAGSAVICASGKFEPPARAYFMVIMGIGILASLLIGAAIGTWSKNQMMSNSIAVPLMIVLSFSPMLSMFNATAAKISRYIYSRQISLMLNGIHDLRLEADSVLIIGINILIAAVLFFIAYKKCKLA